MEQDTPRLLIWDVSPDVDETRKMCNRFYSDTTWTLEVLHQLLKITERPSVAIQIKIKIYNI